jgi:glycopeptide antibiotics resistance protein
LSLVVESCQYVLVARSSEVQDVPLNILRGGIGTAVYRVALARQVYGRSIRFNILAA